MSVENPLDPGFRLTLPNFEGPLDLLLHVIQSHELNVLDLPIAFVTERFLTYLDLMKTLHIDVAAEYLLMAATLAHIKSKMLLPTPPAENDDLEEGEEADPREELIRRLLEYQKYKGAAEQLAARGIAGRDVFMRGTSPPEAEGPAPLAEIGLFTLLDAFQRVLARGNHDLAREVTGERISIQERITEITERLAAVQMLPFEALFEKQVTTYDLVVTFLAILEMAKMRLVRVYQSDPSEPIFLQSGVSRQEESAESTPSVTAEAPLPETVRHADDESADEAFSALDLDDE